MKNVTPCAPWQRPARPRTTSSPRPLRNDAAKRKAAAPRQAQSRYEQPGQGHGRGRGGIRGRGWRAGNSAARTGFSLSSSGPSSKDCAARSTPAGPRDAGRRAAGADAVQGAAAGRDGAHQERDHGRLAPEVQRRSVRAEEAARRAEAARDRLTAAQRQTEDAAVAARCASGHHAAADGWEQDPERARRETEAVAGRQARAVDRLRPAAHRGERRGALQAARAEEAHRGDPGRYRAGRRPQGRRRTRRTRRCLPGLPGQPHRASGSPTRTGLLEVLQAWAVTGDGANPAVVAVGDAARAAGTELGRLDAELSAPAGTRARIDSRVRSAGCARVAMTPRQLRTRGSTASGTAAGRAVVEGDRFRAGRAGRGPRGA